MELLFSPEAWLALLTLTALEIVLGIDNIIFISILVDKLPKKQQNRGRIVGLGLAMLTRILLLVSIFWIMKLTTPLFEVFDKAISGRDLILIIGGLFLLFKSTHEIHSSVEDSEEKTLKKAPKSAKFLTVVIEIAILDIVFSLDSVITAIGMADHIQIMIAAVIIAIIIMMFASKAIGDFVNNNPTIKMLALSFLLLVGMTLIAEGMGLHIPKGYIYFAMAFALGVELLNIKARNKRLRQKQG